jgi:hypothetical protein
VVEAELVPGVLDADAHPEVGGPVEALADVGEPLRSFGEHLVLVLGRVRDHFEDPADVVLRHLRMEEVAHRVHEDRPG